MFSASINVPHKKFNIWPSRYSHEQRQCSPIATIYGLPEAGAANPSDSAKFFIYLIKSYFKVLLGLLLVANRDNMSKFL